MQYEISFWLKYTLRLCVCKFDLNVKYRCYFSSKRHGLQKKLFQGSVDFLCNDFAQNFQ